MLATTRPPDHSWLKSFWFAVFALRPPPPNRVDVSVAHRVNHTIISFSFELLLILVFSLAAAIAASVVVVVTVFFVLFIRFVSFYLFIYLCWACVYLSGSLCQCIVHGTAVDDDDNNNNNNNGNGQWWLL